MVGDLQDVHPREVGGGGKERALGRGLQVAEEEDGEACRADQQGDAGVVGVGAVQGGAVGTCRKRGRRGPQHPPVQ
jgi:hypothetical protein